MRKHLTLNFGLFFLFLNVFSPVGVSRSENETEDVSCVRSWEHLSSLKQSRLLLEIYRHESVRHFHGEGNVLKFLSMFSLVL